jgi:hypothetical protein
MHAGNSKLWLEIYTTEDAAGAPMFSLMNPDPQAFELRVSS